MILKRYYLIFLQKKWCEQFDNSEKSWYWNSSLNSKVNVGVTFIQLLSINEQLQVMKSNVMLTVSWFDYQLKWDPSEYHGIKVNRMQPVHDILSMILKLV